MSDQPAPLASPGPAIWPLVIADMAARDALGRAHYHVPLQPQNGRDSARDLYEELLDGAAYGRQLLEERAAIRRLLASALRVMPLSPALASQCVRDALDLMPERR